MVNELSKKSAGVIELDQFFFELTRLTNRSKQTPVESKKGIHLGAMTKDVLGITPEDRKNLMIKIYEAFKGDHAFIENWFRKLVTSNPTSSRTRLRATLQNFFKFFNQYKDAPKYYSQWDIY